MSGYWVPLCVKETDGGAPGCWQDSPIQMLNYRHLKKQASIPLRDKPVGYLVSWAGSCLCTSGAAYLAMALRLWESCPHCTPGPA